MADSTYDDSVLELYTFETTTLLGRLTAMLREAKTAGSFSRAGDAEMQRIMATIKNSSDMMRFDLIADIAAETENLFAAVSAASLTEEEAGRLADAAVKVAEYIGCEVDKIQNGEPKTENADALRAYLKNLTAEIAAPEVLTAPAPVPASEPAPAASGTPGRFILHIYFYEDSRMENVRAYMLTEKLTKIGTVLAVFPEEAKNDPEAAEYIKENGFYLALETTMFREQLEKLMKGTLSVESVSFIGSMPGYEPATAQTQEPPAASPAPVASAPVAPVASAPGAVPDEKEAALPVSVHDAEDTKKNVPSVSAHDAEDTKKNVPFVSERLECLRISCGGESYSLPVSAVEEVSVAESSDAPSVSLAEKLGIKNTAADTSGGIALSVFSRETGGRFRLRVDDVIGTQVATRLDMPAFFDAYNIAALGISGCALSENGDISLLLDPALLGVEELPNQILPDKH
ncbi:MAG: hypothetical protein LBC58_06585 [Clostridiales Family XIII bacterium]|jgi:chemotaxis protein histidine kinase CheA|nr:hypothetical protein [Clostridiales Family XIII bacterium]